MLAGAAAGVAWPVVNSAHPVYAHLLCANVPETANELAGAGHKPLFLSAQQMASLEPLAETMVPGSGAAQVSPFIDLLLSVDSKQNQRDFISALEAIDAEAHGALGAGFSKISPEQRVQALKRISEMSPSADRNQPSLRDHFENVKEWIVGAYYSSEMGMRELGWTGNRIFETYPECQHGTHASSS